MRACAGLLFILAFVSGGSVLARGQEPIKSIYTDLKSVRCKTIEIDKESGSSVQKCPGIGGYVLLVEDDDARESITVLTPGGKKYPLDFSEVITQHFSSVGNKAEWPVVRKDGNSSPVGLIVRVNASENVENYKQVTSYLAVAKITAEQICVTHKIPSGVKANEEARRAADSSHSAACLKQSVGELH